MGGPQKMPVMARDHINLYKEVLTWVQLITEQASF